MDTETETGTEREEKRNRHKQVDGQNRRLRLTGQQGPWQVTGMENVKRDRELNRERQKRTAREMIRQSGLGEETRDMERRRERENISKPFQTDFGKANIVSCLTCFLSLDSRGRMAGDMLIFFRAECFLESCAVLPR